MDAPPYATGGHDPAHPLDAAWLERYSRQILLKEVGGRGQQRLQQATVGILGAGPMATPLQLYLAAAGIGHLVVTQSGEQESPCTPLHALNPQIKTTAIPLPCRVDSARRRMRPWDLVVLTADAPAIRNRINRAALQAGKTLLCGWRVGGRTALAIARAGQDPQAPCLLCMEQACAAYRLPASPHPMLLPMAAGTAGCVLAMATLRFLLDNVQEIWYGAQLLDPEEGGYTAVPAHKNPLCPACRGDQRGQLLD